MGLPDVSSLQQEDQDLLINNRASHSYCHVHMWVTPTGHLYIAINNNRHIFKGLRANTAFLEVYIQRKEKVKKRLVLTGKGQESLCAADLHCNEGSGSSSGGRMTPDGHVGLSKDEEHWAR